MATFQQRRDPVRVLWRRVLAVLLLIGIAIMLRGAWGVYEKSQESRLLKMEAEAKLHDLETREFELRANIANLRSDKGVEAELRERYDLAQPGEGVVVIVDPPEMPLEPQPTPLQKLKHWLW